MESSASKVTPSVFTTLENGMDAYIKAKVKQKMAIQLPDNETTSLRFSSVQFKMYYALGKAHMRSISSLRSLLLTSPLIQLRWSSDWRCPSLLLSGRIFLRFLSPRLSPPGDRWCDVLGVVPAGCVSSSTFQIFRETSHMWGYTHRTFRRWMSCQPLTHSSLDFPFLLSLSAASLLNLWEWWDVWSYCHFRRQSCGGPGWLLPPRLSSWGRDSIGCTVFTDGVRTLFDNEAPPWPVFGGSTISVHYEVLRFAVFLISDAVFPAGHSRQCFPKFSDRTVSKKRRNRFGYLSHSLVCLSSLSWYTCSTESSAWPVQGLPYPSLRPCVSFTASRNQ